MTDTISTSAHAGSLLDLQREGRLLCKVGALPVVVVWHEGRAFAIEDRCPHLGFPLHQGSVEAGLLTCHWHHARFDLVSGCTLDPWADDAQGFDVELSGDDVIVHARPAGDRVERLQQRLRDGLEQGLTLVIAKAVQGLLETSVPPAEIVRTGIEFGCTYRAEGWGAGLTTLVAMANVLDRLDADDQTLALVHALAFVSRDTRGRAPRFAIEALRTDALDIDRLSDWYRRFIETRAEDASERVLATAIDAGASLCDIESFMEAAITDHVFIDEGHTLDFTNKAFEALGHIGAAEAATVLPTLVRQTASAQRSEEFSEWRHPHDLVALTLRAEAELPAAEAEGRPLRGAFDDVAGLGWRLLDEDPEEVVSALLGGVRAGATPEQLGRAVAYAASLRILRFHVQNDFGDWNTVHHAFTAANALHQALTRAPTPELMRGLVQGAMRVYLDRFLNVPAARLPTSEGGDLAALAECWEVQGRVDDAGRIAFGFLRSGGRQADLCAALGHALLAEDTEFHWFQVYEASMRQVAAWPEGSEEAALVLTGLARFLAAHTPTRRELPTVVRIAQRLRRGEALYEES
jgi:nitrite reductase/ring-hydroxylating ferredoxin subunit